MTDDSSILAPVAALQLPDHVQLTQRAKAALDLMQGFSISSAWEYDLAADELKAIKARAAAIEEQRTGITGPLNQALRAVNALFKGPSELLEQAESVIKGKMLFYVREQQRIAAEERARAEAAAAAERKRLEEEAAAQAAAAQQAAAAAQQAQAAGDTQSAAIAEAQAVRAQSEAAATATAAQLVVAAPVVIAPPAAKGISVSTKVDFEVTSLHQLVMHVAEHAELLALLKVDEVKLRAYVRGLGAACALPGVRVFETPVMSARKAA